MKRVLALFSLVALLLGTHADPGLAQQTKRKKAMAANGFPESAFVQEKTHRKPGPVMDAKTIQAGLKSHDRALYVKSGWICDPYITLGPDDFDYLLCITTRRSV